MAALICASMEGLGAALAVLTIPVFGILHGMFAAFIAGWILTAAEILIVLIGGTQLPLGMLINMIAVPVVIGGALFAGAAALVVWVLKLLVGRLLVDSRQRGAATAEAQFAGLAAGRKRIRTRGPRSMLLTR
jgi:hypothetical protein